MSVAKISIVPALDADKFVVEACALAGRNHAANLLDWLDCSLQEASVTSPIEKILLAALYATADVAGFPINEDRAHLFLQKKIGPYKADLCFLFYEASDVESGLVRQVVVECDGHEFHERTKQQSQHDKRRDRFMQKEGFQVLRFTGSEIVKDPYACAVEILSAVYDRDTLFCDPRGGA